MTQNLHTESHCEIERLVKKQCASSCYFTPCLFQFVCVAQADYYRILTQGERSIQCIEEGGQVVMVTEFRKTDGGSRQGQVVIKVIPWDTRDVIKDKAQWCSEGPSHAGFRSPHEFGPGARFLITFRARKALLCLSCLHSRSKFQQH